MNWIIVRKFPLSKDLTHVSGFLHERSIQHRIYEEAGEQVVAVADPRMVAPIAQLLHEVESGKLVIQQDATDVSVHEKPIAPSLLEQIFAAPITAVLIVLSALGALLGWLDAEFNVMHWFTFQDFTLTSFIPFEESLAEGQLWRVVTPAFLHFGALHFIFNSLWMWDLGRRLELYIGRYGYLFFFIITATISNCCQYFWAHNTIFGGMSGVVYALVGFMMVSQQLSPHPLTAVPKAVLGFMLCWLVLCMTGVIDYFAGGVANAAHIGGLLAGCGFAFIFVKFKVKNNPII